MKTISCTRCQRKVDTRIEKVGVDNNGNHFCMSCFDALFGNEEDELQKCSKCKSLFDEEPGYLNEDELCPECSGANDDLVECSHCLREFHFRKEPLTILDGAIFCPNCFESIK